MHAVISQASAGDNMESCGSYEYLLQEHELDDVAVINRVGEFLLRHKRLVSRRPSWTTSSRRAA